MCLKESSGGWRCPKWLAAAPMACDIHYDNAAPEQIEAILSAFDELINEALVLIKRALN